MKVPVLRKKSRMGSCSLDSTARALLNCRLYAPGGVGGVNFTAVVGGPVGSGPGPGVVRVFTNRAAQPAVVVSSQEQAKVLLSAFSPFASPAPRRLESIFEAARTDKRKMRVWRSFGVSASLVLRARPAHQLAARILQVFARSLCCIALRTQPSQVAS